MDRKFLMRYLTNPQNGWTQEEAEKFCNETEKAENQQPDFWTDVTGLTSEQRAKLLKTAKKR